MYAGLTPTIPPASEPVSVADAKAHSRISIDADDGMVAGYITAARQYAEKATRRALLTQSWRLALRYWPGRGRWSDASDYYKKNFIELPRPPLQSITSFTYADVNGATAHMTASYNSAAGNYILDTESEPGRIYLPFSGLWPTTILAPGAPILITYRAGYASYGGTVSVDGATGLRVTWQSGDKFAPGLAGTFIQVAGISSTVLTVTDDTHLILAQSVGEQSGAAYAANIVPHGVKQAILFLAAHYYENRETVVVGRTSQIATQVPFTVDASLDDFRNHHPIQEA